MSRSPKLTGPTEQCSQTHPMRRTCSRTLVPRRRQQSRTPHCRASSTSLTPGSRHVWIAKTNTSAPACARSPQVSVSRSHMRAASRPSDRRQLRPDRLSDEQLGEYAALDVGLEVRESPRPEISNRRRRAEGLLLWPERMSEARSQQGCSSAVTPNWPGWQQPAALAAREGRTGGTGPVIDLGVRRERWLKLRQQSDLCGLHSGR